MTDAVSGENTEWRHAKVDAPDARYSQAFVRVVGRLMTVRDRRSMELLGEYELDTDPVISRDGRNRPVLAGRVGGIPATVTPDCSCNKPTKIWRKGR